MCVSFCLRLLGLAPPWTILWFYDLNAKKLSIKECLMQIQIDILSLWLRRICILTPKLARMNFASCILSVFVINSPYTPRKEESFSEAGIILTSENESTTKEQQRLWNCSVLLHLWTFLLLFRSHGLCVLDQSLEWPICIRVPILEILDAEWCVAIQYQYRIATPLYLNVIIFFQKGFDWSLSISSLSIYCPKW